MGEFTDQKLDDELPTPSLDEGAFEILRVWISGGSIKIMLSIDSHRDGQGADPEHWGLILHDVAKNVADAVVRHCRVDGLRPDRIKVLQEVVDAFIDEHEQPTDQPDDVPVPDKFGGRS